MMRGYERGFGLVYSKFMRKMKAKTLRHLSGIVKKSEEDELAEDLTNNVFSQGDLSQLENQVSAFNKQTVADFGKQGLDNVGMGEISFDIYDPKVVKNLKDFDYKLADRLTKKKRKQLSKTLAEGFKDGENFNKLSNRVSGVFKDTIRANRPWSARIAATEVASSANFGLEEGYRQSDVVSEKEWLAAFDARPSHATASGQRVKLNELFDVGGEKARFPGDPRLSADERINCRCTTLPIIKGTEEEEPALILDDWEEVDNLEDASEALDMKMSKAKSVRNKQALEVTNRIGETYTDMVNTHNRLKDVEIKEILIEKAELNRVRAYAAFDEKTNRILMHPDSSNPSLDAIQKMINKSTKDISMSGINTENLFRHEFGHAVHDQLLDAGQRFTIDAEFASVNKDLLASQVSKYSSSSSEESFSEMFNLFVDGRGKEITVLPKTRAIMRGIL